MQHGLALARTAMRIAGLAILLDLPDMAVDSLPALYLAAVFFRQAVAQVITAIPLEPATGVFFVDPALAPPFRQRLAGVDAEIVKPGIAVLWRKLRLREPGGRKLVTAVGHVFAAKDAQ